MTGSKAKRMLQDLKDLAEGILALVLVAVVAIGILAAVVWLDSLGDDSAGHGHCPVYGVEPDC